MSNDPIPTEELESSIPIDGQVVAAVQANFTTRPLGGGDQWPTCSIGVAANSIVATDSLSAILIGEPADSHEATKRDEVDIAAFRAKRQGQPFALDTVARNVDKEGEPVLMPPVERMIRTKMRGMKPIALVTPESLLAIAKVAKAGGAFVIELFQPDKPLESESIPLGFRFAIVPKSTNLFSDWEGTIEAQGVFMTQKGAARPVEDGDEAPEDEKAAAAIDAAPPARPKRAAVETTAADEAEAAPEPEPVVDVSECAERGAYRLPPLSTLEVRLSERTTGGEYAEDIVELLRQNGIPGRIDATHCGPTVTQYELSVPGTVKVSRVAGLADDFQMQLGVQSVRIQAPIPGKKAIGIELPNRVPRTVGLLDLCGRREFVDARPRLTFALGEDIGGKPVYGDLSAMPHLLIAGATNSGKSIGLASILASLLLRNTPKDLRFVMIDPKRVELTLFDRIPHLMCPVIKDAKEAAGVLRAVWREMDRRYDLFSESGVRNVDGWNAKASENERLPYIVVVVDELADLMLQCGAEVETVIVRLAQMARAVGIHMIVATQRPSADIVTGLIKANVPSRIAFAVAGGVDSGIILDQRGAEKLLGRGDMLYKPIGANGDPRRVQGAYVSEDEVAAICRFWRDQSSPAYAIRLDEDSGEAELVVPQRADDGGDDDAAERATEDAFPAVARWAATCLAVSIDTLKKAHGLTHQEAIVMLDRLQKAGVIDDMGNPRPKVLMDEAQVEAMLAGGGDGG